MFGDSCRPPKTTQQYLSWSLLFPFPSPPRQKSTRRVSVQWTRTTRSPSPGTSPGSNPFIYPSLLTLVWRDLPEDRLPFRAFLFFFLYICISILTINIYTCIPCLYIYMCVCIYIYIYVYTIIYTYIYIRLHTSKTYNMYMYTYIQDCDGVSGMSGWYTLTTSHICHPMMHPSSPFLGLTPPLLSFTIMKWRCLLWNDKDWWFYYIRIKKDDRRGGKKRLMILLHQNKKRW